MAELHVVTEGLRFPEGPIAMPDGTVLLVEIERQTLTRVEADGRKEVVAHIPGGPNGAAIGPDGKCYVCNNGGFKWGYTPDGAMRPVAQADDYRGGSIDRVDLATGAVETLYTHVDGRRLCGPNDIVFDGKGGFWFSDLGKTRARDWDRTGIYYGRADGSLVREAAFPLVTPNGVGLSPDDNVLYVAETWTGRLWAFDIVGEGELARHPFPSPHGGRFVANSRGARNFDSLALEAGGNICVATLLDGGITVITPDGSSVEHIPMPDASTTNICFGGTDLRTAYITQSLGGKLIATEWPRPGLPLHFLNDRTT